MTGSFTAYTRPTRGARRVWARFLVGRWCHSPDMNAWELVLEDVAPRLNRVQVEWMLVGSAATALRGAAIEPGDIDVLLSTPAAVQRAAAVFPSRPDRWPDEDPATWHSSVSAPILTWTHDTTRWTFGRWTIDGTKVELAHLGSPDTDRLGEAGGTAVWSAVGELEWRGISLPIVPIEVQIVTMIGRNQQDRLAATISAVDVQDLDPGLLRRALTDQTIEASAAWIPPAVRRLVTE